MVKLLLILFMKDINSLFKLIEHESQHDNETTTFLNTVKQHLNIGSWVVDLEKDKAYWCPITKEIHEIEDKNFTPTTKEAINFYLEGYNRDLIKELHNKAKIHGTKYDIELELISQKGNKKWVRVIGYGVMENNKCIKVLGVVQDITKENRHLKDLILKEKHISTTMDNAANGMALVDLNGKFIAVNKKMCKYFNYTKSELKSLFYKDLLHPKDEKISTLNWKKLLLGQIDNIQIEKKYRCKNNKTVYCISSISLLRDEDNAPVHFIVNIIDISNIKTIERKKKKLLKKTEKQNLRLLNFTHIVSHNLRSHSGNLEMLLDVMKVDLPQFSENEYFPLLSKSVNNLSETIQNLNEVSNINSKIDKKLVSCNLLEYHKRTLTSLNAKIVESQAEIKLDIKKNLSIVAVPMYLDNILLNLISNAIDFSKPDVKPIIKVSAKKTKKHIKLTIKDNGLGIDLNLNKDKIFGLYKTFHDHKNSRGLGLFITKNQVDAIDAKIELTSEVNKGTTFTLFFKYEDN